LVEAVDFAKGTSSRSTKLVHGGVRYLEQGDISLVREAPKERLNGAKRWAPLLKSIFRYLTTTGWLFLHLRSYHL
jgi:glycerol-3-phosphate dehydrogenase